MNLLPAAAPRVNFLVDIGQLVPSAAVTPREAYSGAMLACFGPGVDCAPEHPVVYRIDESGELIEVYA